MPEGHAWKSDYSSSTTEYSMDGVPLKMPQAASHEAKDEVKVIIPDYLGILRETEYEFSLENWVLSGLQSDTTSQRWHQLFSSSSQLLPSCPPYWMMLSSQQQNHLPSVSHCSDFWEPNPRQRCHSLNPAVLRTKFDISDSEDEGENAKEKTKACLSVKDSGKHLTASCQRGQRTVQKPFVPDLLNPPACLSSLPHQRRKNLRQCSLSVLNTAKQCDSNTENQYKSPSSHRTPNTRAPNTIANTDERLYSATHMSLCPDSCRNPTATIFHQGITSSGLDSSELLLALSPEERELLGAITARGYPLHMAIIALQKMGQQTPDQILSYLVACDHLCQLGYDMAQVEEALEMFQNCERKAKEFLHLLSQFNEMGFQQNTIKEVLLVHENHRERALEELMMRVA